MKKFHSSSPFALPLMMARLTAASLETIFHRTTMMAKGTCSPAEYQRMVAEKATAAQRSMAALMTGKSLTAALAPYSTRARACEAASEKITNGRSDWESTNTMENRPPALRQMCPQAGWRLRPEGQGYKLRVALRVELSARGLRRQVRIIETRCMGFCLKGAVTALNALEPGAILTVPRKTHPAEALARLFGNCKEAAGL